MFLLKISLSMQNMFHSKSSLFFDISFDTWTNRNTPTMIIAPYNHGLFGAMCSFSYATLITLHCLLWLLYELRTEHTCLHVSLLNIIIWINYELVWNLRKIAGSFRCIKRFIWVVLIIAIWILQHQKKCKFVNFDESCEIIHFFNLTCTVGMTNRKYFFGHPS